MPTVRSTGSSTRESLSGLISSWRWMPSASTCTSVAEIATTAGETRRATSSNCFSSSGASKVSVNWTSREPWADRLALRLGGMRRGGLRHADGAGRLAPARTSRRTTALTGRSARPPRNGRPGGNDCPFHTPVNEPGLATSGRYTAPTPGETSPSKLQDETRVGFARAVPDNYRRACSPAGVAANYAAVTVPTSARDDGRVRSRLQQFAGRWPRGRRSKRVYGPRGAGGRHVSLLKL